MTSTPSTPSTPATPPASPAPRPLPPIDIAVQRLANGGGLPLPAYASAGAAGLDVVAAETLTLRPGTRHAVPTGFAMAIPDGWEVQVRPRSGLALNHGITCLNSPGTIDSDYRGEVKIILANLSDEPFTVRRGDRIAQLVPAPVQRAVLTEVAALTMTTRGDGGFGSTGTASPAASNPAGPHLAKAETPPLTQVKLRRD